MKVKDDGFFPADMVILHSTGSEGTFYVETKNLDGETNLKLKTVAKNLIEPFQDKESLRLIEGILSVEAPNNRIYKFDGNFDISLHRVKTMGSSEKHLGRSTTSTGSITGNIVALSNDNIALRGMSLRNTEFVTGIVVYTGHDTKIQKNSTGAKYKASNVTHTMNW